MTRWLFRMSLHLESDRPDMPRMADLGAIECGDPQVNAAGDRDVILTFRIEAARNLDRPTSRRPARCAPDVGTIAGVLTGNDHAGNQCVDRILGIKLSRIG